MGFIIKFHSQVFTQKELGKKKRQKKVFWYPKHEFSPESLHSDVTENCKQMRRIWCLDQHTDSPLQVPSLVLVFVLRSLALKNIIETSKVGKFWPKDIFPTLQVIFFCLWRHQEPMGGSCQGSYFMLWVTFCNQIFRTASSYFGQVPCEGHASVDRWISSTYWYSITIIRCTNSYCLVVLHMLKISNAESC